MERALSNPIPAALSTHAVDLAPFDEIVRSHQRRVYRVLLVLVRNADDADSLTQECFLRAFQNLDGFRGQSSLQTWLLRIAVNLARDHARSRKVGFWKKLLGFSDNGAAKAFDFPSPAATPEQALLARAELQAVWKAAAQLSTQQQAVFTLRFVEEMELSEIAAVLGIQVGSVKAQLFRAVHSVRNQLREQQWR